MAAAYQVVDRQTQRVVGTYKSRNRAHNVADRKDNEYGAIRYSVRPVYEAAL